MELRGVKSNADNELKNGYYEGPREINMRDGHRKKLMTI